MTPLVILTCFLFEPLAGGLYALAGALLSAATRRLARKGMWAVAALRLLPIAALGMLPWILLTLTFVGRVRAVLHEPGPVSYALLAAGVGLIIAAVAYVRRRFGAPA